MNDARAIEATLESHGFTLAASKSKCSDFTDSKKVVELYYDEVREMVKKVTGCSRVFVFDHTLRETGSTSLNASDAR